MCLKGDIDAEARRGDTDSGADGAPLLAFCDEVI